MISRHAQAGTALLIVLFILVLLSTLAVYTTEDENIAIRRAENQRDVAQSYQVALAGELWVAKALERDLISTPRSVDYLGDEWALLQSQVVTVEDGEMAVQAVDEAGKFNLNNLLMGKMMENPDANTASSTPKYVQTPWYSYFTRLLSNLGLDEDLAEAVVDWVDDDDQSVGNYGAEDAEYSTAETPYLAANQAFTSVSELLMVAGFGQAELSALLPYITALPVDHQAKKFVKININTAPELVLRSLDNNIDQAQLNNVLQSRISTPYGNPNALYSDLSLSLQRRDFDEITTVNSQFFSAQSCAQFGRVQYSQQSLLRRDEAKQEVTVISRQRRYNCGIVQSSP